MNSVSFLAVFVVVLLVDFGSIRCQTCGGIVGLKKNNHGSLSSLDYPYDAGSNLVCTWTFNATTLIGEYVFVVVKSLGLHPSDGDNLTVVDQGTPLDLTDRLETPFMFAVSSNVSEIKFETGKAVANTSVPRRILFDWHFNDSSIAFDDIRGVVESPLYVPRNGSNITLSWVLSGNPGLSIALAFDKFNIGSGVLTVSELSGSSRTFTGSVIPSDFLAVTPNVKLDLTMPIDDPNLGFTLFYKEVSQGCSNEVTVNETDVIHLVVPTTKLPGTCVWLLKGPENTILSATLNAIESTVNGSDGHLSFHDGGGRYSKSLGLFDSSSLIKDNTVLTSGNRLWIAYMYHDSSVPMITLTVNIHNHGGTLQNGGQFGIPASTANETSTSNTSMWSLVVDTSKRVRVDIKSLSLTGSERMVFHDGNCIDDENILIAFDENSTVIPVVSSKSEMFVVAENLAMNATFDATFTAVSDDDFMLSSTNFGSHQLAKLDSKTNFTWFIKPKVNDSSDVISLMFNMLTIDANTSSFVIYEGLTMNGQLLANITSSTSDLAIHINAAKGALIVYDNDGPNEVAGVLMDAFYKVLPRCVWNVDVSKETYLSSPLYPRSYPINTDCTLMLTAAENKTLLLSFEDVDLADNHIVTVFNGNASVMNLTGTNAPDDYISSGNTLLVKFLSMSLPTNLTAGRGYHIRVVPLDCGGHLTDAKSSMNTPKYPDTLKNTTVCVWSIEVPQTKDVEIVSLAIESKAVASSPATLYLIDGGSLRSPSSDAINASTTSFLSRTGKLMIVYNYTQDLKVDGSAFKFSYTSQVCLPTQLCKNGICMHDDWKCNGINECGDFTDEYNCTSSSTVVESSGVGVATFILMIFIMFFTGVAVALAAPHLWRRVRSPRHYQSFGGPVDA